MLLILEVAVTFAGTETSKMDQHETKCYDIIIIIFDTFKNKSVTDNPVPNASSPTYGPCLWMVLIIKDKL